MSPLGSTAVSSSSNGTGTVRLTLAIAVTWQEQEAWRALVPDGAGVSPFFRGPAAEQVHRAFETRDQLRVS